MKVQDLFMLLLLTVAAGTLYMKLPEIVGWYEARMDARRQAILEQLDRDIPRERREEIVGSWESAK